MPQAGIVDAMQYQIGQSDGIDEVFLFPAIECPLLEDGQLLSGSVVPHPLPNVLKTLGQKAAGAAAGVVHGLANARVYHLYHRFDYLARREELPAVVALLAHLEQQSFVDLREREDMRRIDCLVRELMHFIEYVEEVALGVDSDPLDTGHNLTDDLLPRGGVGHFLERLQMRQ